MDRWKVLRLDYLFSVLIPCIVAIYVNNFSILAHLKTLMGWAFLGIAGNVINDMIDKDRGIGWHQKELAAVALGCLVLGIMSFIDLIISAPINLIWLTIAIGLILGYCLGLKKIAVFSTLIQVFAEIFMPYFTIHIPTGTLEWLWVLSIYFFGVLSQITHEAIDKEAIKKYSNRTIQILVFVFSLLTIGFGVVLFLMTFDYNILPFSFVPFATMYIFRIPRSGIASNIKDVGIIIGNLFMSYFLVLVLI